MFDILEKFFFFLRGDVKSRGDQFDDKFLRNGLVAVKLGYSEVKLIEATSFIKKNFKLKFRIVKFNLFRS